jgi:uncharacterized membrane protein
MDVRARATILGRLLAYGIAGWCMEIVFTAACGAIGERDRSLRGETYLWMLPIYGAGGLLLEELQRRLTPHVPQPLRAVAYVGAIYSVEYGSGLLLRRLLGICPWDYKDRGVNVDGLIRLDFAPFWFGAALAFEPLLREFTRRALREDTLR